MIPVLFTIGPLHVYSYGLMLGISFLLGSYILALHLKRSAIDPGVANTITFLAVIFGIGGAKILYLIEEWDSFVRDPFGMAFSAGGLTWFFAPPDSRFRRAERQTLRTAQSDRRRP